VCVVRYGTLHAAGWVLGTLLGWLAATAQAQSSWPVPGPGDEATLAGDLAHFSDEQYESSLRVTTFRVDGAYAFDEQLALEARMGMVVLASSPNLGPGNVVVRPGNPTGLLGLRGSWHGMRYRGAVGGAAPLAVVEKDGDGRLHRAAYNYAAGLGGLFDLSLWAHSHGSVMLSGMLDLHVVDRSWLTLEFEPTVLIPARRLYLEQDVLVSFPLAATFGQRAAPFGFGIRTQVVPTAFSDSDAFAFSLGPWVRLEVSRMFAQASYLANLFEPLAGARGPGIWALHFAAGGAL
jgi:hypothetical protein